MSNIKHVLLKLTWCRVSCCLCIRSYFIICALKKSGLNGSKCGSLHVEHLLENDGARNAVISFVKNRQMQYFC